MFVFSKEKPKTFNPIKVSCKTAGSKRNRIKAKSNEQAMRGRNETTIVKDMKMKGNVWSYNVGKNTKSIHTSPFPEKLARDQIISWSNKNDLILDNFMGSGTTAIVALQENRNYIGFELSKERFEDAQKRIQNRKLVK
jgi:DNA modification methylase